jgi:hypothetical protein
LTGSHVDSQPLGGRYDGIYGVLAGLEALRTLNERGIETERDIVLVNWTNEEGALCPGDAGIRRLGRAVQRSFRAGPRRSRRHQRRRGAGGDRLPRRASDGRIPGSCLL